MCAPGMCELFFPFELYNFIVSINPYDAICFARYSSANNGETRAIQMDAENKSVARANSSYICWLFVSNIDSSK